MLGDTLLANGHKDDWDPWLPYAVFAITDTALTLGGFSCYSVLHRLPGWGQPQRLPLSLPVLQGGKAAATQ